MSEVCENHGRIRCGECAYIEELKERISEKEAEIERLRNNLNQAIEALEKIDSMEYEVNYGHTHMLYDAKMYARVTLNSIKGGETDATQTSSRS